VLTDGSVTDQTHLVLVNAMYFYATWQQTFYANETQGASFQPLSGAAVQVPTMYNSELSAQYRAADDFAVAELPYEGGHVRMTIVLPAAGKFESVRSQVSEDWLKQAVSGLAAKSLQFAMPKFKLTVGAFDLTNALETLGLKQAFTDQADFSGMSRTARLSVSSVVQKAFIAVDENGTEAAAATAVSVATSAIIETVPFVVDRPFLFFIRDDSGAVLFSGQVVDPSHES
jgi:serpin B